MLEHGIGDDGSLTDLVRPIDQKITLFYNFTHPNKSNALMIKKHRTLEKLSDFFTMVLQVFLSDGHQKSSASKSMHGGHVFLNIQYI